MLLLKFLSCLSCSFFITFVPVPKWPPHSKIPTIMDNLCSSYYSNYSYNLICDAMVSVIAGVPYIIGSCPSQIKGKTIKFMLAASWLSPQHQRIRGKDWLARNQNIPFQWSDRSIHGISLQWASTMKIQGGRSW